MGYNPLIKTTFYYVDDSGMFVVFGDPKSWRDSVGRNFYAYIAYSDDSLLTSMWLCAQIVDGKIKFRRHPLDDGKDMSRDHVSYILMALSIFEPHAVKQFVSMLEFQISAKHEFSIDMWCWAQSLGGSKLHEFLYYTMAIPMTVGSYLWNGLLFGVAALGGDKWKRKVYHSMYPFYAMQNMAWQVYCMRNTIAKSVLQRICRWHVDKTNYAVRMVLGDKSVTWDEIKDHKSTKSWRWGVKLKTSDRDMDLIDPKLLEYNDLEKDYLLALFCMVNL